MTKTLLQQFRYKIICKSEVLVGSAVPFKVKSGLLAGERSFPLHVCVINGQKLFECIISQTLGTLINTDFYGQTRRWMRAGKCRFLSAVNNKNPKQNPK